MGDRYKPNVTVACIIECQERYLIVEEIIDGVKRYNQPAGHLEKDETLVMACEREVFEETGLKVSPQGLTGIYQFAASDSLAFLRFTFFAHIETLSPLQPQDPDISQALWLTYEEVQGLEQALRSPLVLSSLDDFRNKIHYPLELLNGDHLRLAPGSNA
ncbi:NUDIX hydrolase [Shewanella canadensis]|uniref:Phosphatase NudJ n=1 Tax=Shewanella canadensis TaxID=271096 RepID=A0A3S0LL73_9GAMM|nr:NUDIX hydrolase [Shewanella canadensis]RTR38059.1 NUDIX hydrolase [Shewanella canadensis]